MYEPDFDSVVVEKILLPFKKSGTVLKLSFKDPMLVNYSLLVIADTKCSASSSPSGRLTTFVSRYPRYVHAEFLRHRVLSRNAASSRARSVNVTIRDVMENPVIPLFTANQKGMGGRFVDPEIREALVKEWLLARDKDVTSVLSMLIHPRIREGKTDSEVAQDYEALLADYYENGYDTAGDPRPGYLSAHKQNFNRLIEAHTVFEEVITSSYWDNFLELRDSADAQPEIKAIAVLVREALKVSKPVDSWVHTPFVDLTETPEPGNFEAIREHLMISAAEAAQVSYNDKSAAVKATGSMALGLRLLGMNHLSPFEHQAIDAETFYGTVVPASEALESNRAKLVSNFSEAWVQLRPILAGITK